MSAAEPKLTVVALDVIVPLPVFKVRLLAAPDVMVRAPLSVMVLAVKVSVPTTVLAAKVPTPVLDSLVVPPVFRFPVIFTSPVVPASAILSKVLVPSVILRVPVLPMAIAGVVLDKVRGVADERVSPVLVLAPLPVTEERVEVLAKVILPAAPVVVMSVPAVKVRVLPCETVWVVVPDVAPAVNRVPVKALVARDPLGSVTVPEETVRPPARVRRPEGVRLLLVL